MAISELLGSSKALAETIGEVFHADPFSALGLKIPVIPLPHPSGRSIWLNKNNDLVEKALNQLAKALDR